MKGMNYFGEDDISWESSYHFTEENKCKTKIFSQIDWVSLFQRKNFLDNTPNFLIEIDSHTEGGGWFYIR